MDFLYNNFWLTGSLACLAFGGLGVGTWVHQRKRGMDAILAKNAELEEQNQIMVELQKGLKCGLSTSRYSADGELIDIVFSNEFRDVLGLQDLEVFPNTADAWVERIHPEDYKAIDRFLENIITANVENETYKFNYRFLNGHGIYRWVKSTGRFIAQADGTRLFVSSTIDITDEYNRDKLLGVDNREGFISDIEEFLREDNNCQDYAVLYFNIKNFKAVNELFGFDEGDNFLKYYNEKLRESIIRPIKIGRKGDHFVCFVKWEEAMLGEIERICDISYNIKGSSLNIRSKCGIYRLTDANVNVAGMVDRAKLAKDNITDEYIKPYAFFDENSKKHYVDVAFATAEVATAIEEKQFKVYYQPIVDTQTGKIVSAEALVRWFHPEKGLMHPEIFIPALEKNGMVSAVDRYVIKEVANLYTNRFNNAKALIPVSVNLSWMDLYDTNLINWLLEASKQRTEFKGLMRVEITESSYASMGDNMEDIMKRFEDSNIELVLDDFGTGVSSMVMLEQYNFDIVKLDKSFTFKLGQSPKADAMAQSVIDMCHQLGMKVVAEGIETEEQLDFYQKNDCDYIQGFYFYKPMPEEDFEKLLDQQASYNTLVDYKQIKKNTPNAHYKAYLYFPTNEMRQKANHATDAMQQMIGANTGVGAISGFYDSQCSICFLSQFMAELFGYTVDEFVEASQGSYLNLIAPEDRDRYRKSDSLERYYKLIDKDGNRCRVKELRANVQAPDGTRQWVASVKRIEELSDADVVRIISMNKVEERDSFTHLLTKNSFFHELDLLLEQNPSQPCTIMVIDIDDFKSVNDVCGHMRGDEVILKTAKILSKTFRSSDLIGRFGGDEFMVFMPGSNNAEIAAMRAQHILDSAAKEIYYWKLSRPCTFSIGIMCSEGKVTREELFETADKALYKAKANGKNGYVVAKNGELLTDVSHCCSKE